LERLDAFATSTARSFGAAGVLLFCVGAWAGVRHQRTTGGALLLAFFAAGPLFAMLNTVDIHSDYRLAFFARFASMSHVAFAVLVGLGAAAIETLSRAYPRLEGRAARAALTAIVGAITTAPLVLHLGTVDLRDDASGLAYAHDLVTSAPDDALVLLKSDAASQAALYVCAVERACQSRIVLTPGQLWMPWKRRELARRYPTFALPPEGSTSVTRWLVEHHVGKRPVFLHPELVDEAVHGDIAVLPSLLLFRAYAGETALRADRSRFRGEIVGIVARASCEGCALAREGGRSPAAAQLARLYDAAIAAHQMAAAELGLNDEVTALAPLRAPARRGH
jgi:hypothetical protein